MTNEKTIVIEKKLMHKGVYGLAYQDENKIEIDPRQDALEYLDTLIHEKLHLIKPGFSEKAVKEISNELSVFLWDNNYRKVIL